MLISEIPYAAVRAAAERNQTCPFTVDLKRAFFWHKAPEGAEFWTHIYNRRYDAAAKLQPELFASTVVRMPRIYPL